MKKVLAILLASMLIIMSAVTVLAVPYGPDFGAVPRTGIGIVIDGDKDAVYEQGLQLNIDKKLNADQSDQGGGGTAWLLWDDTALYVFVEVNMLENYDSGDNANKGIEVPWELDNVELLIDFTNDGERPIQYRVNSDGFLNVTMPDEPWLNGEEGLPFVEHAGKKSGTSYTVEYKVIFASSIREANNLSNVVIEAGKAIGVQMMVTDVYGGGDQTNYMLIEGVGPWATGDFGWVTLSANEVGAPAPEPEPDQPAAAEAPADEAPAAPVPAPAPAPPTSDATSILIVIGAVAAIAGIIVLKVRKTRA